MQWGAPGGQQDLEGADETVTTGNLLTRHRPHLQAATTKVPEIRDVTRIERIGE